MEDQTSSGSKKLFIVIGVAVLVLGVMMLVLVAASKRPKQGNGTPQQSTQNGEGNNVTGGSGSLPTIKVTPLPTTITKNDNNQGKPNSDLDIAKISLAWLDKQRDKSGVYYGQISCSSDGTCSGSAPTFQSGTTNIWARFKYYEKTKNPADMEIINKDIALYSDPSKVESLQNYSYNCKLMYELYNSLSIDNQRKEKLKRICFDSQPYPTYDNADSININIIDVMQKKPLNLLVAAEPPHVGYFATSTSDFIARTQWEKSDYLPDAKIYFKNALIAFSKLNYKFDENTPILGVAALDLYKATTDKTYLSFANFIYNSYGKEKCTTPIQCANMIYFLQQMNSVTSRPQYQTSITDLTNQMIQIGFDYQGYPAMKSGTGEFLQTNNPLVSVADNGFIAGVLSQ